MDASYQRPTFSYSGTCCPCTITSAGLWPRPRCQPGHLFVTEPAQPPHQELPVDVLVQKIQRVTQLVEFLMDYKEEFLREKVAGLARALDEEPPALQKSPETAEVPPVAPESEYLKSSSRERRLPGSSQDTRK
ncbi:uncharacterized protein LOC136013744 isoform X4 [Lathamus discolor]|uniref:uncharacterized protein LOC136013744 isoform X4 n=1 Tax=Lathamus discolor TaxID=678569 RepID=UPI0032B79980